MDTSMRPHGAPSFWAIFTMQWMRDTRPSATSTKRAARLAQQAASNVSGFPFMIWYG